MHKWTVRAARVALVAAAITVAGTGIANADDTTGDHSILGGDQIHIPIIAPIGLFGNNVNLLSSGFGGARLAHVRMDDPSPMYQAPPPEMQMDICGNAISSANGIGTAACNGQASLGGETAPPPAPAPAPVAPAAVEAPSAMIGAPATSIGAPGNPIAAPAEAPAAPPAMAPIAAPADAPATAPVFTPAEAPPAAPIAAPAEPPAEAPAMAPIAAPVERPVAAPPAEMSTSGENGIASGNQVKAPVRMPVRICGNAGALGGMATAACEGSASSGRLSHRTVRTLGLAGLLG
jgi:hypothetical protein